MIIAQNPLLILKPVTNPRLLAPATLQHIIITSQQNLGNKETHWRKLSIIAKFFQGYILHDK